MFGGPAVRPAFPVATSIEDGVVMEHGYSSIAAPSGAIDRTNAGFSAAKVASAMQPHASPAFFDAFMDDTAMATDDFSAPSTIPSGDDDDDDDDDDGYDEATDLDLRGALSPLGSPGGDDFAFSPDAFSEFEGFDMMTFDASAQPPPSLVTLGN